MRGAQSDDCGVGRCEEEERRCGVECEEWRAAWSECMMVDRGALCRGAVVVRG